MKKKRIVRLMGGLGNQIFQYFFGVYLCEKYGGELYFDDFSYTRDKLRKNEICSFDLNVQYLGFFEKIWYNFWIKVHSICNYPDKKIYFEKCYHVMPQENLADYKYYSGFWQTMDIYKRIQSIESKSFKCNKKFSLNQNELLNQIKQCNAVALHIRRGDFLLPENQNGYANVSLNYYMNGIDFINNKVEKPVYFIFSDDIYWCRQQFKGITNIVFVDSKYGNDTIIDFELMRNCTHFIIANSTYSWCASWLGRKENSILIAPLTWAVDTTINNLWIESLKNDYVIMS